MELKKGKEKAWKGEKSALRCRAITSWTSGLDSEVFCSSATGVFGTYFANIQNK